MNLNTQGDFQICISASLNLLSVLNKKHPNIKFTIEKQVNHSIAFLHYSFQVWIIKISHFKHITSRFVNFKSFTLFSHRITSIQCLVDRSFKICNNWNTFHNGIKNIKSNLIKNAFLINEVIRKYLDHKFFSNQNPLKDTSDVHYFILPYIGKKPEFLMI